MGGWLVESGWLTTRKPGVKTSFDCSKKRNWWKIELEAGFVFLKVCGEVTSLF